MVVQSWLLPGARAAPSRAAKTELHQFAHHGIVKSWNGGKGFGFITAEGFDGDVMFSRKELPADHSEVRGKFLEGKAVSFQASGGADGRMKVTSMEVSCTEGHQMAGTIKSHSERHGYGFISCSSLSQDVRFDSADIVGLSSGVKLRGELVLFEASALQDGKMRASKIMFQSGKIATRVKGVGVGGIAAMGGAGGSLGMKGGGMGNNVGLGYGDDGSAVGVVKSFSEKNGYGFLNVPGMPFDIKFGQSDLLTDQVKNGQVVRFAMAMGPDGRPQAKQIVPDGGATTAGMHGQKRHAGMAFAAGGGGAAAAGFAATKQRKTDTSTGMKKRGAIKSYNSAKGFGFIAAQGVSGDIFFMRTALPEVLQETHGKDLTGQKVLFEVLQCSDGQMRAGNIVVG